MQTYRLFKYRFVSFRFVSFISNYSRYPPSSMALCHPARAIPFKINSIQFKLLERPDRPPLFQVSIVDSFFCTMAGAT